MHISGKYYFFHTSLRRKGLRNVYSQHDVYRVCVYVDMICTLRVATEKATPFSSIRQTTKLKPNHQKQLLFICILETEFVEILAYLVFAGL